MIVVVSIVLALLFFGPSVCAPSAAAPFEEEEEEEEEAHVLAKKFCLIIIIVVVVLSFGNAPSGGITKPGFANEAVKYVRALMTIAQRNIVCSDADGNGTEDDDFSFEFPSVNKRCNVTKCNAHHTTRALVTSCFWWDDDPASRAFFRASHSGPSEHFKTTSRKTDAMTNCSAFYLKEELNN